MKNLNKLMFTVFLSVAFCSAVQANLIENGSFEDVGTNSSLGYGNSSTWQVYSTIPNWDASQNVEIWNNNFIVPAYDGNRVLELNAHPGDVNGSFSIFQDFATVAGNVYTLTFAGRKRQQNSDEAFLFSVGDLSESIYNQPWGNWNEYSYQFTALSAVSTLTFTSLDGGADTTGNIFDAVNITGITKTTLIPEPTSFLLILLGLTGLVVTRKKSIL